MNKDNTDKSKRPRRFKREKHSKESKQENRQIDFTIALAGNANVGKSVVFNELTGSNQIIGNWPGKTVERAVGKLSFEGKCIEIIDLPGIYYF